MHSIEIVSEDSLIVRFDDEIQTASKLVNALATQIKKTRESDIVDLVPAYTSLSITVDFQKCLPQDITEDIENIISNLDRNTTIDTENIIELPCYYHQDVAPDLIPLAKKKNISVDKLIEIHSSKIYDVYAIGFSPGFPYMGFVDDKISEPRLASPRLIVEKGSVGIADKQTGIYSLTGPGGWNIIGRCPSDIFNIDNRADINCLLNVGNKVRFQKIDRERYIELGGALKDTP